MLDFRPLKNWWCLELRIHTKPKIPINKACTEFKLRNKEEKNMYKLRHKFLNKKNHKSGYKIEGNFRFKLKRQY